MVVLLYIIHANSISHITFYHFSIKNYNVNTLQPGTEILDEFKAALFTLATVQLRLGFYYNNTSLN